MAQKHKGNARHLKWVLPVTVVLLGVWGARYLVGSSSWNPDRVAQAEMRMWQAYYSGDKARLALNLITLLRRQFGLSVFEAKEVGELFAVSAMAFRTSANDYETAVLPTLTEAYRLIQQATKVDFDAEKAAEAELAWWVARRTPGQNSAEQVGRKIADLYAVLYGSDSPAFAQAGLLRAQAGQLRDFKGADTDWYQVEDLLRRSYRELAKGLCPMMWNAGRYNP